MMVFILGHGQKGPILIGSKISGGTRRNEAFKAFLTRKMTSL
jgi:hypothetical protein